MIGDEKFSDSTCVRIPYIFELFNFLIQILIKLIFVIKLYKTLSDREIIREYSEKIKEEDVFPTNIYGTNDFVEDHGTAHTSIIGSNGDAVSITSSINLV